MSQFSLIQFKVPTNDTKRFLDWSYDVGCMDLAIDSPSVVNVTVTRSGEHEVIDFVILPPYRKPAA